MIIIILNKPFPLPSNTTRNLQIKTNILSKVKIEASETEVQSCKSRCSLVGRPVMAERAATLYLYHVIVFTVALFVDLCGS